MYRKIEFKIPVFFGCLGALFFCMLLAVRPLELPGADDEVLAFEAPLALESVFILEEAEEIVAQPLMPALFFARPQSPHTDFILELYRQPEARDRVVDFFAEICLSPVIADVILANACAFDISPALAFALSWEESRFNPQAINRYNRNGSIDRGLFQLNNLSFPRLALSAFFDPETNAYYGMNHLRYCLDIGGTEIAALAMYNAGANRVSNSGTPKATLNYISRILENRRRIESRFLEQETLFQAQLVDAAVEPEYEPEPELDRPRLAFLKPLGIR